MRVVIFTYSSFTYSSHIFILSELKIFNSYLFVNYNNQGRNLSYLEKFLHLVIICGPEKGRVVRFFKFKLMVV